jgi:DNA-binding transcriptional regulator PaaX
MRRRTMAKPNQRREEQKLTQAVEWMVRHGWLEVRHTARGTEYRITEKGQREGAARFGLPRM